TYNGNLMPSNDYWFTVDYSEQQALKQFKAHFSLKR
ncbi:MAG: T9SS type B sorting domain-containing protein, partial [Flavobacterium sp.]